MKDSIFPPRLTDSASDDIVVAILRAGKRDEADSSQAQRSLSMYMATRALAVHTGSSGDAKSGSSWSLTTKLLGSAVVAGAICAGWMSRRPPDEAPSVPPASVVASETPVPGVSALPDMPAIQVDDLPPASAAVKKTLRRPPSTAPRATASSPSLGDELALVEAARSSLARGEIEECLRTLDAHDRRFRDGVLADEVAAMRIEALVAHGERERARALGETFLVSHPASPYTARIQSLLAAPR